VLVGSFFGFGLLLSLTPCVFPMIPILSSIIVGSGRDGHGVSHARGFSLSLAYVLGMAITYAAAGIAAGLTGTLLAAALQNPWVLGSFAAVFVAAVAVDVRFLRDAAARLPAKQGVGRGQSPPRWLVARAWRPWARCRRSSSAPALPRRWPAPCSTSARPAMPHSGAPRCSRWGWAWARPCSRSASPPARCCRESGPWMEAVKKAFGVILLATAVWLVSPVIPAVVQMLAWALLLIVPAIYLHALDPLAAARQRLATFLEGHRHRHAAARRGDACSAHWPARATRCSRYRCCAAALQAVEARPLPFTRVRSLAELESRIAAAGQPVMLDFYADWCVSCKEMERFTFADPRVQAKLAGWTLLQADVTANSDADKALLQRFKLYGPPGIIFFDRTGREIEGVRVVGFQDAEAFLGLLSRLI
jgi:thiol:disulfide interchange protein DsbD